MVQQPGLFDELNDENDSPFLPASDISTIVTVGVREIFGLAYRDANRMSYAEATAIGQSLLPGFLGNDSPIVNNSRVSDYIQVDSYEQRAKAQRLLRGISNITALSLINEDIAAKEEEIKANPNGEALKKELRKLQLLRQKIKPDSYTEHQVIERDILQVPRVLPGIEYQIIDGDVFQLQRVLPVSGQGKGYKEFQLPHNRALRLMLFHPNKPEYSTGVDVVYEHYDIDKELVRIIALQYKLLKNNVLDISNKKETERFSKQKSRMRQAFCDGAFCKPPDKETLERWLCPHYCSAFIRPTDQKQKSDARYISTGYHIPLCKFDELWNASSSKKFELQIFQGQSIKSQGFEELFNMNELGSKWFTYQQLEDFYKQHNVLDADDRIVIHAQELARA